MSLSTVPVTEAFAHTDVPDTLQSLRQLFQSGDWVDLTIVCGLDGNKTFRVHKAFLCSRSPVFANACRKGSVEAVTDKMSLPERPDTVEAMLKYLYGVPSEMLQCTDHATVVVDKAKLENQATALTLLYLAAEKYKLSKGIEAEVVKCMENLLSLVPGPYTTLQVAHLLYENLGDKGRDVRLAAARATHRRLALIMPHQKAKDMLFANPRLLQDVLHQEATGNVARAATAAINRAALFAGINDVIRQCQISYITNRKPGLNRPSTAAVVTWSGGGHTFYWVVDWLGSSETVWENRGW